MTDRTQLTLRVAEKKDFAVLNRLLLLLALLAASLSPHPFVLTLLVVMFIGAGRLLQTLSYPNVADVKLMQINIANERIRLHSKRGDNGAAYLHEQYWCTRWFTVLRVTIAGDTQNHIILSGQQSPEEFRRLNVWLRQGADLFLKSEGIVQS